MRLICHVDMNSYFASVEQQANPHLRGRAVGVCAYLHRKGCVIAASVEAKRLGMKVGMSMEEAMAAVPNAVFVQNDPSKYRMVTERIFRILCELTDVLEPYSIDEAFLDLTGWYRDPAEASFALSRVKHRIATEVGEWLRCSIGLAPTKFLAKFASERKKPDGLTVITQENIDEMLASANLEDACGIGPRIRRRLNGLHIHTLLELKRHPIGNLIRAFGKNGFYLWAKVNGIECENVTGEASPPKSIGHSYCTPNSVNRDNKVEAVLSKLTERAGRRLRAHGLFAGGMIVTIGFRKENSHRRAASRFPVPVNDSFALARSASRSLNGMWRGEPVDFLAVTLTDLSPPTRQMRLDRWKAKRVPMHDRSEMASASADAIRDRYGENAIVLGRMFKTIGTDEVPDRIGYRKSVPLESVDRPDSVFSIHGV